MAQAGPGRLYGVLEARGGGTRPSGSPGGADSVEVGNLRPIRSSSVSRARKGGTSSSAGASASAGLVPSSPQSTGCANLGGTKANSFSPWGVSPMRSRPACGSCDKAVRKSGGPSAIGSLQSPFWGHGGSLGDGRWHLGGVWDRAQQLDEGKLLGGAMTPLLARGMDALTIGRVGLGPSSWIGGHVAGKKSGMKGPLSTHSKMEKAGKPKDCHAGQDPSVVSDDKAPSRKLEGTTNDATSPRGGCRSMGKPAGSQPKSKSITNPTINGHGNGGDSLSFRKGHRRSKSDMFGVSLPAVNGACKPAVGNGAFKLGTSESLSSYPRVQSPVSESHVNVGQVCRATGTVKEDVVSASSPSDTHASNQARVPRGPTAFNNCKRDNGSSVRIELAGALPSNLGANAKPNDHQSSLKETNPSLHAPPILRVQSANGNPTATVEDLSTSSAKMLNGFRASAEGKGVLLPHFSNAALETSQQWDAPVASGMNHPFAIGDERASAPEHTSVGQAVPNSSIVDAEFTAATQEKQVSASQAQSTLPWESDMSSGTGGIGSDKRSVDAESAAATQEKQVSTSQAQSTLPWESDISSGTGGSGSDKRSVDAEFTAATQEKQVSASQAQSTLPCESDMSSGTGGIGSDKRSVAVDDSAARNLGSGEEHVEHRVATSSSEGDSELTPGLCFEGTKDCGAKERRQLLRMEEPDQGKGKEGTEEVTPDTLWKELEPHILYLSKQQLSVVHDALKVAFEAHDGQKRKSGEPYIIHPVAVAQILGGLEMDCETIVAGLLHDTVEDTMMVTFEGIEDQFGTVVRRIVEGETKVSKLGKMQAQNSCDVKADDLRQMFLAMTEEVRVIIVKLADRLHNMRTLSHMPPQKQKHIAEETLQVFAPLAKLLGMYQVKSELEDWAFMYAYPKEYAEVQRRIDVLCNSQEDVVLEAKNVLLGAIKKDNFLDLTTLDARVVTICKEPYSIFKKLQRRKCLVEEVSDITQLRIVLKMKPAADDVCNAQQVCYHVLGIIHAMWPPVPGTVKDYIATPKPNGYQSLHTTILPLGSKTLFPLEIQIRTEEMDKLAEWGIAANHSGKGISASQIGRSSSRIHKDREHHADDIAEESSPSFSENKAMTAGGRDMGLLVNRTTKPQGIGIVGADGTFLNDVDIARRVSWLNSIREWQEEFVGNMTAREFVDTIMGDLLGSRVFVFTPEGEVKNLPKGATVIDYAYHIHTDVGNKMIAAKVNGNIVSPTRTLCNAEVVDIITYDGPTSKKSFELHHQWLKYARTRSARHKLTKFLKDHAAMVASEITAEAVDAFVNGEAGIGYIDDGDEADAESREVLDRSSPEASTSYRTSPFREKRDDHVNGAESGLVGERARVLQPAETQRPSSGGPRNMGPLELGFGTNLYEKILMDAVGDKDTSRGGSHSKNVSVGEGASGGSAGGVGGGGGGGGSGGGGRVRKLGRRVVETTGPWSLPPSSPSSSRSLSPSSSRSLSPSRSTSPSRATPPSRSTPPSGNSSFMRRATCTTEGGVYEQLTKSPMGPINPGDEEVESSPEGYSDANASRARLENILGNGSGSAATAANVTAENESTEMVIKPDAKDKLGNSGPSVSDLAAGITGNPDVVNTTREMGFVADKELDPASKAILSVFDAWEMQTVSTWHAEKGRTIVWMSVHYIDRKGLLADVSLIFSKHGIGIDTFSGRTDRNTGVGVMLFELNGPTDMGDICSQVETVPDVLSWVMGCTWQYPNKYMQSQDRLRHS